MEGDSLCLRQTWLIGHFNPLPPHGGRRSKFGKCIRGFDISIHSLRMEGDFIQRATQLVYKNFNPLPPHGGRRVRMV